MTVPPRGEAKAEPNGKNRPVDDIRAWRGHAAGLYGLPHYPSDPPMVTNNKGWWRDVDALLNEVDRLRVALEEAWDFRCFNENRVGDPCPCCVYVTDHVDSVLGGARHGSKESRRGA